MNWNEKIKNMKWVCGLKTYNSGPTVYACLQSASKIFNNIIITDDGSTDETIEEITRFISENKTENLKVVLYKVGDWDPLPDAIMKRDHGNTVGTHPTNKSHTKAQIKNFLICKKNFPDAIYFSLEDDVILYDNIKKRILERISRWPEPETDCEYFNLVNTINKDNVRIGLNHAGMKRRKLYENSGDWTFCCFWTGGKIQVGPDPGHPWGACMFPWLPKNQTGKKGQDIDEPYGLHLLYCRRTRHEFQIEDGMKRIGNIKEIKDDCIDTKIMEELDFKIKVDLDKNGKIIITEKKHENSISI